MLTQGKFPPEKLLPGDCVAAYRKEPSKAYSNTIVGPVIELYENKCVIQCNKGELNERCWILPFDEWWFQKLF